ncbi:hypothetical protein LBW60_23425 [Ralstonia solanacearum]|uniref:hypothetical protein n=1 Tax=Ralstonia solanacearum TaxID=305 RepID=UPI0023066756|nr:hypothetical protein [Ralstonia solanacearum]MDB0516272.1 hypothetical protein [Ralstonia solanacearum]
MSRRPHLRIVASNGARDAARAAAERDYRELASRVGLAVRYLFDCMLMPFRLIIAVWTFCIDFAIGFVRGVVRFFFAMFGLGLICSVVCAVGYVLLWPLFH